MTPMTGGCAISDDLLLRLALALAIGLVVGVERGWRQRDEPDGGRTAGVRTFTLVGLLGGVCAALSLALASITPWIVGLTLLTATIGVFSYRQGAAERDFSVTTVVAAMLVFVLGVLAVVGDMRAAAAGGVVTAAVLASRQGLHRAIARLTWIELRSALLLLGMTAIVLPILPNRPVDPLGALNPRELWLLMILVAAVSYCGYIALKLAGSGKGPAIAGLAGGLASSTATTVALARRSRQVDDAPGLGAGVALAAMVSLIRASIMAIALQPALGPLIALPAGLAAAVFAAGGAWPLIKRGPAAPVAAGGEVGIPFELSGVLGFGALLAVVTLAGAWVAQQLGPGGGYLFAAVSGLLDVDAITLSMARATEHGATYAFAATAILIAFAANAAQRVVFAWAMGSRAFALRFTLVSGFALAAGAAGLLAIMLG